MVAHELGQTDEDALALLRREPGPHARLERLARTGNGVVDVLRFAGGDRRDHATGAGTDAVEGLA